MTPDDELIARLRSRFTHLPYSSAWREDCALAAARIEALVAERDAAYEKGLREAAMLSKKLAWPDDAEFAILARADEVGKAGP